MQNTTRQLAAALAACSLLIVMSALLGRNPELAFLCEGTAVLLVVSVVTRPPERLRLPDRRTESRLLFVAGLCSSLVVTILAHAPLWAFDGIRFFATGGMILFLLLGTIAGAAFPILRRSMPTPTIAVSLLYSILLWVLFLILKPLTYSELPGIMAEKGPGLWTALVMWVLFGVFLGGLAHFLGFERSPLSGRMILVSRLAIVGIMLGAAALWLNPIPYARPGNGLSLEHAVPPGFEVAHISRPSFARLAQFDLGNDLRWGFRNDMHLCISYDFKKSGTTLSASIYKGTRNSAEKELAFWQQHVSRENSTIIEAPSVGDQSLAWEEGGLEGELKALVFAKDRFLVQIYAAPGFEDSPAPSWGDLDSLAHTVEDRLR